MTHSSRELDVVVFGATGYVGRLTAQHLVEYAPPGLRVGLAGRSADRLARLRADLGPVAADWPTIVADIADRDQVAELAGRTAVLATTVGPYAARGLPLVLACARAGTHYADLTGETLFVRDSMAAAHSLAEDSGARIVHACGFDSVPSDLGVGLAAAQAAFDEAGELTTAVLHVRSIRGGVSGGTIASLRQQIVRTKSDPALRRVVSDPFALTGEAPGISVRARSRRLGRDRVTGRWHAPFVLGGFNRQIVQRSNALTGWSYGRGLRYREVLDTGTGPLAALGAAGVVAGTTALLAGFWFGPTRKVLTAVLPDPGEGPSERTRRRGRFVVEVDAQTRSGRRYRTRIAADKDPGYGATAVMLAESAVCLALDALPRRAGVLTPMVAMGGELAGRLRMRGFTVSTELVKSG